MSDPADVVRSGARCLAQFVQLSALLFGKAGGDAFDLQQHRGQRLSHIVVQLAGHPPTLGLLDRESAARAVAPLVLESLEHAVEGVAQCGHVGVRGVDGHAPTRRQRVDAMHRLGQRGKWPQRTP